MVRVSVTLLACQILRIISVAFNHALLFNNMHLKHVQWNKCKCYTQHGR